MHSRNHLFGGFDCISIYAGSGYRQPYKIMYTTKEEKGNMKKNVFAMVAGFCLDMAFGDPAALPHPICWIGNLIEKTEKNIRNCIPAQKKQKNVAVFFLFVLYFYYHFPYLPYFCIS